jgi:hypothetical protein
MLAMNRRDRVAMHATLNGALGALSQAVRLCRLGAFGLDADWLPVTWHVDLQSTSIMLRRAAQDASDRKNDAPMRPGGVQLALLDNAATLRDIATRLERMAAYPDADTGDWTDLHNRAEQAYQRLWGQRDLMRALFPVD